MNNSSLPILTQKKEIIDSIRANRVIVISGETGCGKTTQIPQFCLQIEKKKLICCTQPRRVAAISVAERVEQETGNQKLVGWQHRFQNHTSPQNKIKFVTDGILLSEIFHDPMLSKYGIIMIDEAHERTLNIDFLLGHLKKLITVRKDLKLIISSATIETERFKKYFDDCPIIHIAGRTFPITIEYFLSDETNMDDDDSDDELPLPHYVTKAVDYVINSNRKGDILVFLPGERDIRDTCEILTGRRYSYCEIIPLMANLPPQEQRKAFKIIPDKRRIIVSTNVAETSVTIPGIKVVIDSGVARISRYNHRNHLKKLHIEAISQASANQRAGRCGRIAPGLCIRLFSKEDFERRPLFTDPEIKRTSLAGTILSMMDRNLGDITEFPFIEPPPSTAIREGFKELLSIQAIERKNSSQEASQFKITKIGRRIAKYPIEPRVARMLIEAEELNVLDEVLTISAFLSGENPMLRPADAIEQVNQAHAKFKSKNSDFETILLLWQFFHPATPISSTAKRKLCKKNFISFKRLSEWEDIKEQLFKINKQALKSKEQENHFSFSNSDNTLNLELIHKSILPGLIPNIGLFDQVNNEYRGIDGKIFNIFPGSNLAKSHPQWIIASEIVDTSRTFARHVAPVNPKWIEFAAKHLTKIHYTDFYWDNQVGTARAKKTTTLGSLIINTNTQSDISRVLPEKSRELFIEDGIAKRNLPSHNIPICFRKTFSNMDKANVVAEKNRTLDTSEQIADCIRFFDKRIPQNIVNLPAFSRWFHKLSSEEKDSLVFTPTTKESFENVSLLDYPKSIIIGENALKLSYVHNPNSEEDGITCTIKMENIPLIDFIRPEYLVPGFLKEKITKLVTAISQFELSKICSAMDGSNLHNKITFLIDQCHNLINNSVANVSLEANLSRTIFEISGVYIHDSFFKSIPLPRHLHINWRVLGANGKIVFEARELSELNLFYKELQKLTSLKAPSPCPTSQKESLSTTPTKVAFGNCGSRQIIGYGIVLESKPYFFNSLYNAIFFKKNYIQKLLIDNNPSLLEKRSNNKSNKKNYQTFNSFESLSSISINNSSKQASTTDPNYKDALNVALFNFIDSHNISSSRKLRPEELKEIYSLVDNIITLSSSIEEIKATIEESLENLDEETADDIIDQINWMIYPGYIKHTPLDKLAAILRYLEGIEIRIANAIMKPDQEISKSKIFGTSWSRYTSLYETANPELQQELLSQYRWAVEETRLAVWATKLAKPGFSVKRLEQLWKKLLLNKAN